MLRDCVDPRRLKLALESLPNELREIYARMLNVIQGCPCKREAITLLQLLVWSEETLRPGELVDALSIRPEERPAFQKNNRLFDLMDVIRHCSSLVTVVTVGERHSIGQLAHSSVREYLTSLAAATPLSKDLSEITAKGYIAELCITYIMCADYTSMYTAVTSPTVYTYPFSYYALNSWSEHARGATFTDKSLVKLILELFQNQDLIAYVIRGGSRVPLTPFDVLPADHAIRPLYYAAFFGLEAVTVQLLKEEKEVKLRFQKPPVGPLHAASSQGFHNVVRTLLDKGADINAFYESATALMAAARSRSDHAEQVMELLLDRGARIEAIGPLQLASYQGFHNVVRKLMGRGLDVNAIYGNVTALMAAARCTSDHAEQIAELLLDWGADIDAVGERWGTALETAIKAENKPVEELLLQRGADVNAYENYLKSVRLFFRLAKTWNLPSDSRDSRQILETPKTTT